MDMSFIAHNLWLVAVLVVWDIAWKAAAMWKAARNNDVPWYIALLILNTFGILPILYIYLFDKKKKS